MSESFSSSGILSRQGSILNVSESFTSVEKLKENPNSYCSLYQAQRYGRKFVLKVLKTEYANQTVYQELLKKEFLIMNQLDHPNIIRVYSIEDVSDLGLCIVMEFIDGKPIDTCTEKNILEILSAMQYIHARQIIHRDLKPSNILLTHNGNNVKVIDFGLSDTDDFATLKQPAGTRKYASPEQLAGDPIDNRTDIYAFGQVLQELGAKGKYRKIIAKCCQENPAQRYANVGEIKQAIAHKSFWWIYVLLFILLVALAFLWLQKRPTATPISNKTVTDTTQQSLPSTSTFIPEKVQILQPETTQKTNHFPLDRMSLMDTLEYHYEQVYIDEIQRCIKNEDYREDVSEQIANKCDNVLKNLLLQYHITSQRQTYELKQFAESCHEALPIKYANRLQQCQTLVSLRQQKSAQQKMAIIARQRAIEKAVDYYIYKTLDATGMNKNNMQNTDIKALTRTNAIEVQQANHIVAALLPIYEQSYKSLQSCTDVGAQIAVFKTHYAQIFTKLTKLQKKINGAEADIMVLQVGFYRAMSTLHKRVIAQYGEFEYLYSSSGKQIYISVEETAYKKSPLYRNISAAERTQYIDNFPQGHRYAPNEVRYKRHLVYTISTKQYVHIY